MTPLPKAPRAKLDYLRAAARHVDAIGPLLTTGAPIGPVLDYASAAPDVSVTEEDGQPVVTVSDHVVWRLTVDGDGKLLGHGFSGFRDLMAALGIDFSGQPYVAGDGS